MHFTSSKAAKEAVEDLKTINENLTVKAEDDTSYPSEYSCEIHTPLL